MTVFVPVVAAQQVAPANASQSSNKSTQTAKRSDSKSGVTFASERLSVNVQRRSLERLASEISDRAGIRVALDGNFAHQVVSVNFQNLALDEGLKQIFGKYDSFFFYSTDEQGLSRLRAVWIYPKGKGMGILPVPPDKWASTNELQRMLSDKDPDTRGRAIEALAQRKQQAALQTVLTALQDDDAQVRARALYGALKSGIEIPEGVLNSLALNDASPDVRVLALQALASTPNARAIAERALNDPSEAVRVQAHEILGQSGAEVNQSPQSNQPSDNQVPQNQ